MLEVNLFGIFYVPTILGAIGLYSLLKYKDVPLFAGMMAGSNLYFITVLLILVLAGLL